MEIEKIYNQSTTDEHGEAVVGGYLVTVTDTDTKNPVANATVTLHTYCTPISWEEAMPGDLVFYPGDSHVGIVGGRDESGNLPIIHCASGANNVVITGVDGFTAIGRPVYFTE